MTKAQTIDDRLERIAIAGERQADALEGILKAIEGFEFTQVGDVAHAHVKSDDDGTQDASTDDQNTAEDTGTKDEAPAEETQESSETEESSADDGEGDPLGDGDAGEGEIEVPDDLNAEHVRDVARQVMEKDGKAAVFEVLAEVGSGYKAVGEIKAKDLEDAFVKMAQRLRG